MPWQRTVADTALELEGGVLVYRDVGLTVPRQQGKSFLVLVLMLTRGLLEPRQSIAYAAQTALDARKKLLEDWRPGREPTGLSGHELSRARTGVDDALQRLQIQLIASTAKAGHGRVLDLAVLDEAFA